MRNGPMGKRAVGPPMTDDQEQMISSLQSEHIEKLTPVEISFIEDLADVQELTTQQDRILRKMFDQVAAPPL